jgi:hypothetical protein
VPLRSLTVLGGPESSRLACSFARQGVKIRIRKGLRPRNRPQDPALCVAQPADVAELSSEDAVPATADDDATLVGRSPELEPEPRVLRRKRARNVVMPAVADDTDSASNESPVAVWDLPLRKDSPSAPGRRAAPTAPTLNLAIAPASAIAQPPFPHVPQPPWTHPHGYGYGYGYGYPPTPAMWPPPPIGLPPPIGPPGHFPQYVAPPFGTPYSPHWPIPPPFPAYGYLPPYYPYGPYMPPPGYLPPVTVPEGAHPPPDTTDAQHRPRP